MEHKVAVKMNAASRYVLGELTEAERDEYEEHVFDCLACAEELKYAEKFKAAARQAFAEDPGLGTHYAEHGTLWQRMFQSPYVASFALAAVILAVGGGSFRAGMAHNRQPQLVTAEPVLLSEQDSSRSGRGSEEAASSPDSQPKGLVTASANESFKVNFEIPPGDFDSYDITVTGTDGFTKMAFTASQKKAQSMLEIIFPAGTLQSGKYFVVVRGVKGTNKGEPIQFPFILKVA
jgi:hypothetical protein